MAVKFDRRHYNAIAKLFRENFPNPRPQEISWVDARMKVMAEQSTITDLILKFTHYFKEGDPGFKPLMFLDACSPDIDRYPLSELWEEDEA